MSGTCALDIEDPKVIVNGKTKIDRERYVSGTCALDLVHEVPQETFVRVLRSLMTMITILTTIMKKVMVKEFLDLAIGKSQVQ